MLSNSEKKEEYLTFPLSPALQALADLPAQSRKPWDSALVMHSKSASAGPGSGGRTANRKQSHSSQWMVVLRHVSRSLLTQYALFGSLFIPLSLYFSII